MNKKVTLLNGFKKCKGCHTSFPFQDTAYEHATGVLLNKGDDNRVEILFDDKKIIGNADSSIQWIYPKHFKLFSILDIMKEQANR